MKTSSPRDRLLLAAAAAALLLAPAGAEPLLTEVAYVEGAATYSMFDANSPGRFFSSLHPGMALPSSSRVEVADDAKVMLSPVPEIRFLLKPGARFVNESFGFHENASGGKAFDYRVRLALGILVGDVTGPLRDIDSRIETPRAVVTVAPGHFLVAVDPAGATKCAVLRGGLTVSVLGDRDYHIGEGEMLTVLSDRAQKEQAAAEEKGPGEGRAEQQQLGTAGTHGVILGFVADDPELAEILAEPFPVGRGEVFAGVPAPPSLESLPGQDLTQNPANLPQFPPLPNPNPSNGSGQPPISPILP